MPTDPEPASVSETTPPDNDPNLESESTNLDSVSGYLPYLHHYAGYVIALLISVGVTFYVYATFGREQLQQFQDYGYFGIFMTSLIGNASIALPIPSLFFTFVGGGTFNWVIVGLVSGIGEALGESTGYLAGYGGSAIIENRKLYTRMKYWMENHGMLTLFTLAVIPNPFFDIAGIVAGASRYGYHKFLFSCWMGKTIKTLVFALAGAYSVNWFLDLFNGWLG